MQLTGISEKVFIDRYAAKDKAGDPIEDNPDQMWHRIAKAVAEVEEPHKQKFYERAFYSAMKDFKYVPGGRILAGAGTGYAVTYYNCFVIPSPKDSRGGILECLGNMVEIMSRGGGVGINLSSLRPRGARVKKVNGFSSGPMNWAELFSITTRDIIQQGGTRRGALMLMMWDWHPDIEEFITIKQDPRRILGANLSVCVSDTFMDAVEKDLDWQLKYPDLDDPEYDEKWDGDLKVWEESGKKVIVKKTVKARAMWDMICEGAWRSAEPGIVFMERYNKYYNNYYWARINCTNPCGEEGLPPWGVCNLGSINLSALVKGDDIDKPGRFDFNALKEVTRTGVRFQDNVVEMDPYIFDGIKKTQYHGERRIGLGTMGLGDALIKLHLRYGSPESLEFIDKVYRIIRDVSYETSTEIAKEKGSFGKFQAEPYLKGKFIEELPEHVRALIKKNGIRNSLLLMQAPTGSTSLMANTTSGIEPVFAFEIIRHDRIGKHVIRHTLWEKWYAKHGVDLEAGTIKKPSYFVASDELTPKEHVDVQAYIQKYVDASISKTVNAPNSHTVDEVKELYMYAYKQGLKGVTYFRDGSRQAVLYRSEEDAKKGEASGVSSITPPITPPPTNVAQNQNDAGNTLKTNGNGHVTPVVPQPPYAVKPRPMVVNGSTYKVETPVGGAFITVNTNSTGEPLEVFIIVGKAGTDVYAMAESLGRIISLTLRLASHLPPHERIREVIRELEGIGGGRTMGFGRERVKSLPDAVAKVLSMHFATAFEPARVEVVGTRQEGMELTSVTAQEPLLAEVTTPMAQPKSSEKVYDICPKCGEALLVHEEGCKKCYGCGYSEC